jgi:NADH-quinone oxidoreductase subunit C
MSQRVVELARMRFPQAVLSASAFRGDETIVVRREDYLEVVRFLKDSPGTAMDFLVDLTCVDWPGREPRFDVVVHLRSHAHGHRVRVKVGVPEGDCACPSLAGVYRAANWFEREAFDMYGVRFAGHPDLRRILLYEEFEGHPLRKDYPKEKRQPLVPARDDAPAQPPPFPERAH